MRVFILYLCMFQRCNSNPANMADLAPPPPFIDLIVRLGTRDGTRQGKQP